MAKEINIGGNEYLYKHEDGVAMRTGAVHRGCIFVENKDIPPLIAWLCEEFGYSVKEETKRAVTAFRVPK